MTRVTLRLPDETYGRLKCRHSASGQSLNELIVGRVLMALVFMDTSALVNPEDHL
ncbi:MAG: hypothetical protein Q7O66_19985 [Dehalococcoidia bacterium]|nr:hypothetical protein [Dehalococcoidia bacterium]